MNKEILMKMAGIEQSMVDDFTEKGKIVVSRFEKLEERIYQIDMNVTELNQKLELFFKILSEIKENG